MARERSRSRDRDEPLPPLKLKQGGYQVNHLALLCLGKTVQHPKTIRLTCAGCRPQGGQQPSWMRLERAFTKPPRPWDSPRLKWCQYCNPSEGNHRKAPTSEQHWLVVVPREVSEMLDTAELAKYLPEPRMAHAKQEMLALEDTKEGPPQPKAPRALSPGRGP